MTKNCKFCKEIFETKRNAIFCGKSCSNKFRWKNGIIKPNPKTGIYKFCKICNKEFYVRNYRKDIIQCCSIKCGKKYQYSISNHPWIGRKHTDKTKNKMKNNHANFSRENHPNWKGGISPYITIYMPNHPFADSRRRIRRSKFVMEQSIGRFLTPEEVVHHKGTKYPIESIQNRQDDRIENLQLFKNQSEHIKFHNSIFHKPPLI